MSQKKHMPGTRGCEGVISGGGTQGHTPGEVMPKPNFERTDRSPSETGRAAEATCTRSPEQEA